jgi:hypothetical protein
VKVGTGGRIAGYAVTGAQAKTEPTKPAPDTGSAKNPEGEAENPGGRPTDTVKGSAPPHPAEPQGQQGSTMPDKINKDR